jgi:ferric-dicitrate binding protein FerR (iron transport regulator)
MKGHLKQLIQRYSEGKLHLLEQIRLLELLADSENQLAEEVLKEDLNAHFQNEATGEKNMNPVLAKVHHKIRLNEFKLRGNISWFKSFQKIAAVLFIPLLFSFTGYIFIKDKKPAQAVSYAEIQCPLGVRTRFQLPDGSTGFLNSGSSLKYPVQFTKERCVDLVGEAFFDVTHDERIPFYVKTKNLSIKVLGTSFNVIADTNEKMEEIILEKGRIVVSNINGKQLAVLSPNDQLTMDTEKNIFSKKVVIAEQYIAWKEGKLVFRNENMQQVARRLSRWYNAEIIIGDKMLEDYAFHATFLDEPLDEVLKLISITTPISYEEADRTSDKDGMYQKRKIILRINRSKMDQFK